MEILASFLKICACTGLMGAGCWIALHYSHFMDQQRFSVQLLLFIALLLGATLFYLLLTWVFRCPEIEEVYGIAVRRERSPAVPGISE
jgi:hypothetical protein